MARQTDPAMNQLSDMLDPMVHRAHTLIIQKLYIPDDKAWPLIKTDDKLILTVDRQRHQLLDKYIFDWQSTQSPPAGLWARLVARFFGKAPGDQLIIVRDQSRSTLRIAALQCEVVYRSGGFNGEITIVSRAHKVTAEDVLAYLEQHPLPTIPTA